MVTCLDSWRSGFLAHFRQPAPITKQQWIIPVPWRFLATVLILLSLVSGVVSAAPPVERYYASSDYIPERDDRDEQRFESYLYNSTRRKIHSEYSNLVWEAVEDEFEDGQSFSVHGPEGMLFDPGEAEGYWGYRSTRERLDIFVLFDRSTTNDEREALKPVYIYKAFIVKNGKMSTYDCAFNVAGFVSGKYISINKVRYSINIKDLNFHIMAEVPRFIARNGIDISRDHCKENPEYLGKFAVALNKDEAVHPNSR